MKKILFTLSFLLVPSLALGNEVIKEVATAKVTCTSSPTPLRTSISIQKDRYLAVNVPSNATTQVYVGSGKVSAATGFNVPAGKTYSTGKKLSKGVILYCVTSDDAVEVRIQETVTEGSR